MAKNILILGGGQQGKFVAEELNKCAYWVTVADIVEPVVSAGIQYQYFDATDVTKGYRAMLGSWFKSFDVVVGALPSKFGARCVELAVQVGVDYVDLSFTNEDLQDLDPMAKLSGSKVFIDCGLSPGIGNMIVGKIYRELGVKTMPPVKIYVGGNATDPGINAPFGYVNTWSLEDLYEEYVRPARFVQDGVIKTVHPLSKAARETGIKIDGLGDFTFDAFISDGLRSLLKIKPCAPHMVEKTLRWPGHLEALEDWLRVSDTAQEFVEKFSALPTQDARDTVIMWVECGDIKQGFIVPGGVDGGPSAMSMTTGHACAAFVRLMLGADCGLPPGVYAPEQIGAWRGSFYDDFANMLARKNIIIRDMR